MNTKEEELIKEIKRLEKENLFLCGDIKDLRNEIYKIENKRLVSTLSFKKNINEVIDFAVIRTNHIPEFIQDLFNKIEVFGNGCIKLGIQEAKKEFKDAGVTLTDKGLYFDTNAKDVKGLLELERLNVKKEFKDAVEKWIEKCRDDGILIGHFREQELLKALEEK